MCVAFLVLAAVAVLLWNLQNSHDLSGNQGKTDTSEIIENLDDTDTKTTEVPGYIDTAEQEETSDFINATEQMEVSEELSEEEILDLQIKEILSSMTLEQKVAQIFFVAPESLVDSDPVVESDEAFAAALEEYPVGGVVYFAKNLVDTQQTTQMLADAQQYYESTQGLSLFLAVDEEGGRVRRIGKNESFGVETVEAMGTLAKKEDTEVIFEAADTIGAYLKVLGFNVDFAPDADVITNSKNTVIGDRSFGTDPKLVSDMAGRYSDGLHNNGILSCYKHFPGHGGTVEDSHTGAAYTYKTREELLEAELVPFMNAEENGVDFVMVAHICVPEVTGEESVPTLQEVEQGKKNIPATFSQMLVTDILRNELGYQGIIITDSLSMGAITDYYDENEAAVYAFLAGCDMLLMPKDFHGAYEAVLSAVKEGRITEERLDESVYRIIKKKL